MKPAAIGTLTLLLGFFGAGIAGAAADGGRAARAAGAEIRVLIDQLYDLDFDRREEADRLLTGKLGRSHVPLLREGEKKYADVPEVKDRIFRHRRRADLGFDPERRVWLSDEQVLAAMPENMRAPAKAMLQAGSIFYTGEKGPFTLDKSGSQRTDPLHRDAVAAACVLRRSERPQLRVEFRKFLDEAGVWTAAQMEEDLYDDGSYTEAPQMGSCLVMTYAVSEEALREMLRPERREASKPILRRYLAYGTSTRILFLLLQEAGKLGIATEEELAGWLRSETRDIHAGALWALFAMRSPHALREYTDMLKDKDEAMRAEAVARIGAFNDPDSWDDLEPMLGDPSKEVISRAMQACAHLDLERTMPKLDAALADGRSKMNTGAAMAVMKYVSGEAFEKRMLAASRILSGENCGIMEQIVLPRLRKLPAEKLGTLALEVIRDGAAAYTQQYWYDLALANATSAQGRDVFDTAAEPHRRAAALAALAMLKAPEDRPRMRKGLDDENVAVRAVAAKALGELGIDEDLPFLRKALAGEVAKANQHPDERDARPAIRTAILRIANKSILDRPVNVPVDDGPGEE